MDPGAGAGADTSDRARIATRYGVPGPANGSGLPRFARIRKALADHWPLLLVASGFALLAAQVYLFVAAPIYRAEAAVTFADPVSSGSGSEALRAGNPGGVSTAARREMITSGPILEEAVDRLRLDVEASPLYFPVFGAAIARTFAKPGEFARPWWNLSHYAWGGERIAVERLNVPDVLLDRELRLCAAAEGRYRLIGSDDELVLDGQVGRVLQYPRGHDGYLQMLVSHLMARPGTCFTVRQRSPAVAIRLLEQRLSVAAIAQQPGVLQLAMRGTDPAAAAATVNEIANGYLRQALRRGSDEYRRQHPLIAGSPLSPDRAPDSPKGESLSAARVLAYAVPPTVPESPHGIPVNLLFLAAGFSLGVVWILARQALRVGLTDPERLEGALALPVFAVVPHSPEQAALRSRPGCGGTPGTQQRICGWVAVDAAQALAVESLRSLRTRLCIEMTDSPSNTISIIAPRSGAGSTFICANLGVLLAQSGKRTLLIDADLRGGGLARLFGASRQSGLAEVLRGDQVLDDVIQATPVRRLDLIPAGSAAAVPAGSLAQRRFRELARDAGIRYQLVIVDCPPVSSDQMLAFFGPWARSSLLVVRAGVDSRRDLQRAVDRLRNAGTPVTGIVLNDA